MKICFISFSSPQSSIGGIERYLDTTFKEITKRGIKVHFIAPSYGDDEIEVVGNLVIHKLKIMNLKPKEKSQAPKKLYNYLKKLIKKEKIDIISAENFYRGTPPGYAFAINLASMETKVPVVLRMHAHFKREIEKALVKDLFWSRIIPVSKHVAHSAYEVGVKLKKLKTVYPPIDTEIFRPDLGKTWLSSRIDVNKNDLIILHASRITGSKGKESDYLELKGVLTLLKAFSTLAQNHKNIKLLIATGTPPPTWKTEYNKACKKISEIAELNGIKDKVIVQPFKLDEMPYVYNGSDIFVMASQMESFGLVYAEALACGIPVVGTGVGGIPEIIDNEKTGLLVEPDNPVTLSKKIDFLLNNPKIRKGMGIKGRKVIERKFASKKITDNLMGIFESVLNNKKVNLKDKLLTNFQHTLI
tara:strand:+ start:9783 stop:11027 length:1245 start_codon:yes stop_codon:yes gene_type:complete